MLQEIFKEVKYNKCEEKQKKEQGIIYNWINILDEVESDVVNEFIQIDITTGVEKERNVKIKLEDVLFFLTGSKFLSSNISNGTILFNHETEEGRRIKIRTCLYSIEFPVNRQYCGDGIRTRIGFLFVLKDLLENCNIDFTTEYLEQFFQGCYLNVSNKTRIALFQCSYFQLPLLFIMYI